MLQDVIESNLCDMHDYLTDVLDRHLCSAASWQDTHYFDQTS